MPRISCLYLGTTISEENSTTLIGIAKEKNIPMKQMIVDRGAYFYMQWTFLYNPLYYETDSSLRNCQSRFVISDRFEKSN